jgi:hypothetical protein
MFNAKNVSYTQEDGHVCCVIFKHAADQFDSSGIVSCLVIVC